MTLRDWFAGQALAGLLAGRVTGTAHSGKEYCMGFSQDAYDIADAMLAARKEGLV